MTGNQTHDLKALKQSHIFNSIIWYFCTVNNDNNIIKNIYKNKRTKLKPRVIIRLHFI